MEVIYAVNNRPPRTDDQHRAYERNQAVLNLPIYQNVRPHKTAAPGTETLCEEIRDNLNVYAIDMSSPGQAPEASTVGLARQRLLGETALRFAQRGRDGILFFSDVDTRMQDVHTVQKTISAFRNLGDLIAVPGAMTLEIDPGHPEGAILGQDVSRLKMASLWHTFKRVWEHGSVDFDPFRFYGPCSIVRASVAVETGGFETADRVATDVLFGEKLISYAAQTDQKIVHGRDLDIGVVSALRWSKRTRNTTQHAGFELAAQPGAMMVESPFNAQPNEQAELTPHLLDTLAKAVSSLPGGVEYVNHMFERSFIASLRLRTDNI
jgi:hypothetical protein